MNVNEIITIIKKRRDELRMEASGSTSDPAAVSGVQIARGMTAEYDSLLARIEASIQANATVDDRK